MRLHSALARLPLRTLAPWIQLLRPRQWSKNLFCLAGVLFSGNAGNVYSLGRAGLCAAAFCLLSSAVYIFNDIRDIRADRLHPVKKFRPLARGEIPPARAAFLALFLLAAAFCFAALLPPAATVCLVLYAALQTAYTLGLKSVFLLDVVLIAVGFVLRLLCGVYAVPARPTAWITLATFCLSIFLALCKRRAELSSRPAAAAGRPALAAFSLHSLDSLITTAASATLLCYSLFCVLSGKSSTLLLTVPIVFYAVSRYQNAALTRGSAAEEPEWVFLRDRPLQAAILIWLLAYMVITKLGIRLFD